MNRVTRISRRNIRAGSVGVWAYGRIGVPSATPLLHYSITPRSGFEDGLPRRRLGEGGMPGGLKSGAGHPKERELDILLTPLCRNNPLSPLTTEMLSRSSASEFGRCPIHRQLKSSVMPSPLVIV